ncbi:BON domain-containing protein [Streptomyces virginiae]
MFLRTDEDLTTEVRESVVKHLFPLSHQNIRLTASQGIATLTGQVRDRT